jgi:FkbM family methyltransferase
MVARKLVRSVLVRFPRVYGAITAQWRYRMLYRLRLVHEQEFRALPLLLDRPDPLVLDVGGNNGQSILSIKRVLPNARVVTFEPGPGHANELRALAQRLPDITVETYALADADGESELHWPIYNGLSMDALASLDRNEVMSWLGPGGVYGFNPQLLEIRTERVVIRRLDDLGIDPDFIKLDVQGTEAKVIAGGLETIRRTRPSIMAEELHEGSEAHQLLQPLGYEICTFINGKLERGETGEVTNRFLVPEERLPTASA